MKLESDIVAMLDAESIRGIDEAPKKKVDVECVQKLKCC